MLTLPFPRNPFFTGREDQLQAIHIALTSRGRAALSGLGGIGKTQTALEYAYRYRDDYRYVFWVGADTELELTSDYVAIAQRLDLPLKDAENQDETVQYVRLWLSREDGWLLIFDNGDRPELVQPFLPRELQGHILVTSRAQDFQDLGIVQPIAMETLSPEEAVAFFLTRTGRPPSAVGAHPCARPMQGIEPVINPPNPPNPTVTGSGKSPGIAPTEWDAAADLAAELGYLPLALEQAAAYIVTTWVPFAAYLKSYRKQRLKRLEKAKPKLGHYPDSVDTTWALNLKEVQKQAPAAAALLNYCAFLHADAVPFNLFTQGAAELGEPLATALADAADDPLDLYDLLNPLCSYSLVRVETERQSFSLHRLVQEVIRAEMGDEGCQNWVEPLFRAIARLLPGKDKDIDYKDWPTLAPLVNHVQELTNHCQQRDIASTDAADAFHVMGVFLQERGQFTLADLLLKQGLMLRQSLLGNNNEDVAASLDRCAASHMYQGRYKDAEILFKEAIVIRKRLLGKENLKTASSINGLAETYRLSERFLEAEKLYQQALITYRKQPTNPYKDISSVLNNLALLYTNSGRLEKAQSLYIEAMEIDKEICGEESIEFSTDLHNLSLLQSRQGKFEEAKKNCAQALKTRKLLLGQKHPLISDSLYVLGSIYLEQGKFEEAEKCLLDTLSLDKELLSQEHPHIAVDLSILGHLRGKQGRYGEAEPLYQQALVMRKRLLGQAHPHVAQSLNNLAGLYVKQGRYGEAEPLHQQALAMRKRLWGDKHPDLAQSLNNLALLYAKQGRYEEAAPLYQQALGMRKLLLGEAHPDVAISLFNLGALRYNQGRYSEAQTLLLQAQPIYLATLGPDHPNTQALQSWIDRTQAALDNQAE